MQLGEAVMKRYKGCTLSYGGDVLERPEPTRISIPPLGTAVSLPLSWIGSEEA